MPDNNDNEDKKVKDLLDGGTRADLERWFGMQSFEALAEQGIQPEPPIHDPEVIERRKRQDEALAAVDPALLERHRRRIAAMSDPVKPLPPIEVRVDPGIAQLDASMIEQRASVAEPREIERPDYIADALAERTPQALLRDLHRPELDFQLRLERTDAIAEYRTDPAERVTEIMKTSLRLPPAGVTPVQENRALLRELRVERRQPWINIEMPLRRVTE